MEGISKFISVVLGALGDSGTFSSSCGCCGGSSLGDSTIVGDSGLFTLMGDNGL